MAKDKLKFLNYTKLFIVFLYILYAFVLSTKDLNNTINGEKILQKNYLLGEVCLSILGGSNVKWGISAEQLNTKHCIARNYGVDNEGGTFENYTKWFSKDSKTEIIIYSSAITLSNDIDYQGDKNIFPTTSIMSKINEILKFNSKASDAEYDLFGDLLNYDCRVPVRPFNFNSKVISRSDKLIVNELNRRIKIISEITAAKEIYVRIPPVYVSYKDLEIYKELMNQRIGLIREMGINVIETTTASSDMSLFCESALHPGAKGRYFFTNELKEKMKIYWV